MSLSSSGERSRDGFQWVPGNPSRQGLTARDARRVPGLERTWEVDVTTELISPRAIHGPHRLRVTLPRGYGIDPDRRHTVLYLLHGGDGGSSAQWTTGGGQAEQLTESSDLIVVMPDGGKVGWYVDWVDDCRVPQAWEQYHLGQLVPWVDANLATIADRSARAIAGISMGGFGAVRYAQRRPDLFCYVASFSGALSLGHHLVRNTIRQQSAINRFGASGPFGIGRRARWAHEDPRRRLDALRYVRVALYSGTGTSLLDPIERTVAATTRGMHRALTVAGIDHRYWTPQPPGPARRVRSEHSFPCWNAALGDLLPDLSSHLAFDYTKRVR